MCLEQNLPPNNLILVTNALAVCYWGFTKKVGSTNLYMSGHVMNVSE